MLVASKSQVWQDLERTYARTIDGLGKHIDPGIMDVVVALNANDIHTTASCEGHLDWGTPYPWVDIGALRIDPLEQQIAELLSEGRKDETEPLYYEIGRMHFQEEIKLVEALDVFYQHHVMDYDRHLIFIHDIRGECRVRSQGGDTQRTRDLRECARKLKAYQDEMHAFAVFLKERFFDEEQAILHHN
jgi:hypothetical protein